jgi:hypothetical protein
MDQASGFEIETSKHDSASKKEIGVTRIFSPLLVEAKFPRVLRAKNTGATQSRIEIVIGMVKPPTSPARWRIT